MKKRYISESFIKNKVGINENVGARLNNALLNYSPTINVAAMALPAVGVVLHGVMQKLTHLKWRLKGCAKEFDPNRKIECEIRERNRMISALTSDRRKCQKTKNPAECIEKVDIKIDMLKSKNANAYG